MVTPGILQGAVQCQTLTILHIAAEDHLLLDARTGRQRANVTGLKTSRGFRLEDRRITFAKRETIGDVTVNLRIALVVRRAKQHTELIIRP